MSLQKPPTLQPIITDESGFCALPWTLFFNQMFNGDAGDLWIPTVQGLSVVGGAPTFSGRVYRLSQYLALFFARITPPGNGNVSGTAGSYWINNFPLQIDGDAPCLAVSGNLGTVSGMCNAQENVIFPPGLTTVTVPITVCGIVEAH